MRKVTATVIYKNNTIYNLVVNHKGTLIPLVVHSNENGTFQTMYKLILDTLKNNNFYCGGFNAFGRRWYDIQFINLESPVIIETFGYENGGEKN